MDFEFSEEQEMFRKAIRDFARTEVAPLVEDAEKNEAFPAQLFPRMGELGYVCISYPTEYGGAGMGKVEEAIEWEEMSQVSSPINSGIMVQSGLATSAIMHHGSEALKQEYLVPAIKGKKIAAFGLTESNVGSDVAGIETTAKKEGGKYIINGNKLYTTNGMICDFLLLAVSTDKSQGRKGISIIVVPKDAPGFSRSKVHKFCYRSSDTGEFAFDNCTVPEENLVGEEGRGFYYLMESLDVGRVAHASSRVGVAQACFESTLDYAKQRIQFGRPIATFQTNAFKLARMALEIESARWMAYRAAWLYDNGKPCVKEAAMAKLLASEVYQRVAIEAAQIYGGAAVYEESVINRHYRDSYLGKITEGTSEIQELVISRQLGITDIK